MVNTGARSQRYMTYRRTIRGGRIGKKHGADEEETYEETWESSHHERFERGEDVVIKG